MDIGSVTGLGHIPEHLLIELGDHNLAVFVPQQAAVHGDGLAFRRTYADGIHLDAQFRRLLGRTYGVVLVVLTVGDDYNDAALFALRAKALDTQANSVPDGRSLHGNGTGVDAPEEHLGSRRLGE